VQRTVSEKVAETIVTIARGLTERPVGTRREIHRVTMFRPWWWRSARCARPLVYSLRGPLKPFWAMKTETLAPLQTRGGGDLGGTGRVEGVRFCRPQRTERKSAGARHRRRSSAATRLSAEGIVAASSRMPRAPGCWPSSSEERNRSTLAHPAHCPERRPRRLCVLGPSHLVEWGRGRVSGGDGRREAHSDRAHERPFTGGRVAGAHAAVVLGREQAATRTRSGCGPVRRARAREPQWWGPAAKAGYFACRSDPSDDPAAPPSPTSARRSRRTSSGSRGKPSAPASKRGPHARASEWPCGAPTKACAVSRRSLNDPGCVRPWRQFASMAPPCSSLPGVIALRVTSCSRRRSSAP
jgi:hypothetical protein